jgi:hypothetical protein
MFIMLMAFTTSMYLLTDRKAFLWTLHNRSVDPSENPYSFEEVLSSALLPIFKDFVFTSFGDFGMTDGLTEDWMQYFIFTFAVIFMCLIMLNLLIGILSESMAETLSTKVQSDYAALCDIIFDIETLMFWVPIKQKSLLEKKKEF